MRWKIGDTVALDVSRGIVGDPAEPRWHALMVGPSKEARCKAALEARGVFSFYPKDSREYVRRGKRFVREMPAIPRIVYARFRQEPHWDVLTARKIITGFFQHADNRPVCIRREDIRILQGLESAVERVARLKAQARMVKPGDRAIITSGPFQGQAIIADRCEGSRVEYTLYGTSIKGIIGQAMLAKGE